MPADTSRWSGEGDFTGTLVACLEAMGDIDVIRVEDAPAGHAGSGYAFLSNEIYLGFARRERVEPGRWLGIVPVRRRVREPALTLAQLAERLAAVAGIGPPDYDDEGMLQYLRAERVRQPYQTRGVKLVELVRLYAVGHDDPRRAAAAHSRP
jgi:hypothetical protein